MKDENKPQMLTVRSIGITDNISVVLTMNTTNTSGRLQTIIISEEEGVSDDELIRILADIDELDNRLDYSKYHTTVLSCDDAYGNTLGVDLVDSRAFIIFLSKEDMSNDSKDNLVDLYSILEPITDSELTDPNDTLEVSMTNDYNKIINLHTKNT